MADPIHVLLLTGEIRRLRRFLLKALGECLCFQSGFGNIRCTPVGETDPPVPNEGSEEAEFRSVGHTARTSATS